MPSSTQMCAARMIFGSSPSGKTTRFGLLIARLITPRMTPRARSEPRLEPLAILVEVDEIVRATPLATAAHATAGATHSSTRGSNGKGIR